MVDADVTAVTDKTISYNNAGGDVLPVYVASGTLSESCSAPCSASDFPWYPVVGTSAATPLTAIGIANVNAVLSARGLPIVNNGGGSTDIHSVVYSSTYASALTDVTSGSNDIHSFGGYSALTGYDMVTGMGTLNFSTLASRLIAVLTPSYAGGGSGPNPGDFRPTRCDKSRSRRPRSHRSEHREHQTLHRPGQGHAEGAKGSEG